MTLRKIPALGASVGIALLLGGAGAALFLQTGHPELALLALAGLPAAYLTYRLLYRPDDPGRDKAASGRQIQQCNDIEAALDKSSEQLARLNRTLTVLGQINAAIMRIRERRPLLERACEILVERGGFPLAWIYFASDTSPQPVVLAAKGSGVDFVAQAMAALGTGAPPLPGWPGGVEQPWVCATLTDCGADFATAAASRGFVSFAALPLRMGGRVIGGMAMFGAEPDVFGRYDVALLHDLADNISFALEAINQEERRIAAEKDLQLAARVFENSLEGIMITDAANNILLVNKAFCNVTGYQPHEVIGKNPRILSSGKQDPAFYQQMWQCLQQEGEWHGEVYNRRKNGQIYPEWLTISVVKDEAGNVTHFVAVFTDITTRKRIEERLNFLAHYDPLTELPNRVLFIDRLEQSLLKARESKRHVAVMVLDLDRFKFINETFGHSAGDLLLLEAARRINDCLRATDSASRLGGDQFAIVLPEVNSSEAVAATAARIVDVIGRGYQLGGDEAFVSASIGVSLYPSDGEDAQTLLKNAESAMYRAMDEGGARYRFYRKEMNDRSSERMAIEADLRHALERGELEVHYQPVIASDSGLIVGAEALLRWKRARGDLVAPGQFIPLLEETRLIVAVGDWVIAKACEDNRIWREATHDDLFVAVNFSAVQFEDTRDNDPVGRIRRLLEAQRFDPRFLEIELTESTLMRNPEAAQRALHELKEMGVALSIDDFGTGYSSMSYVKRFPFDHLKIDRSFVHDLPEDAESHAIVRAIIAMGHSLNLRIIAEGVETDEQEGLLRQAGCDLLQGFRYSPAVDHEAFLRLVKSQPYRHAADRGCGAARAG
jgi:diguanylate cyclase (GGDEF)-like protein/PAS domain S-box-containing protein